MMNKLHWSTPCKSFRGLGQPAWNKVGTFTFLCHPWTCLINLIVTKSFITFFCIAVSKQTLHCSVEANIVTLCVTENHSHGDSNIFENCPSFNSDDSHCKRHDYYDKESVIEKLESCRSDIHKYLIKYGISGIEDTGRTTPISDVDVFLNTSTTM